MPCTTHIGSKSNKDDDNDPTSLLDSLKSAVMTSSPSLTSPLTYAKTWLDVFQELDQWEDSTRFASVHGRALNTVRGFRRLCSPRIGHLVALRGGGVQLVHNIHEGATDDLDTDTGELWALTGAGGTAATLVIYQLGAYDSQTGVAIDWDVLRRWSTATDLATYNNDEVIVQASMTLPNMLPLPGFMMAALMKAYTTDPSRLCLAAIAAINARAARAGADPGSSTLAKGASYVAAWLWNMATNKARARRLGQVAGVSVAHALNRHADAWARDVHVKYLTSPAARPRTSGHGREGPVGAEVWMGACRSRMRKPEADGGAAKKPKVVPRDSYSAASPTMTVRSSVIVSSRLARSSLARRSPSSLAIIRSYAARVHAHLVPTPPLQQRRSKNCSCSSEGH
jgi:hypothetical protein